MFFLGGIPGQGIPCSPISRGAILPCMELKEALEQANVIIMEEERRPSLQYVLAKGGPTERSNAHSIFIQSRKQRPRAVLSDPEIWEFRSPNYDALVTLLSQIDETNRGLFLGGLLNKTRTRAVDARVSQQYVFPMWASRLSALPLIVEVCIRNGYIQLFLKVLGANQEIGIQDEHLNARKPFPVLLSPVCSGTKCPVFPQRPRETLWT